MLLASARISTLPVITSISEIAPAEIFTAPTYPGGQEALLSQLSTNVKYPQLAREYSIEGTVVLRLSLDDRGQITKREIVRSLGFGCDEAALEAVTALDRFKPAKRTGHRSSSTIYLPLKFQLR